MLILDLISKLENYSGIAAFSDNRSYNFSQVSNLSYNIASYLAQDLQIPSKSRIGLLVERNIDIPVIILGIIKAGYVVVLLNIDDPTTMLAKKTASLDLKYIITTNKQDIEIENIQIIEISPYLQSTSLNKYMSVDNRFLGGVSVNLSFFR